MPPTQTLAVATGEARGAAQGVVTGAERVAAMGGTREAAEAAEVVAEVVAEVAAAARAAARAKARAEVAGARAEEVGADWGGTAQSIQRCAERSRTSRPPGPRRSESPSRW